MYYHANHVLDELEKNTAVILYLGKDDSAWNPTSGGLLHGPAEVRYFQHIDGEFVCWVGDLPDEPDSDSIHEQSSSG